MKKTAINISLFFLFAFLLYLVSGVFLTCNKPINSKNVLLEGWLHPNAVEESVKYIKENNIDSVFVVEMKNPDLQNITDFAELNKSERLKKSYNRYGLYWNGTLGFEIPTRKLEDSISIQLKMHGNKNLGYFPHYKILVNSSFLASGFSTDVDSIYQFTTKDITSDSLTYLFINFDNDIKSLYGDRDLFVSDIMINSLAVDSLATNEFFIFGDKTLGNLLCSEGVNLKFYLSELGYDSSRIKLIQTNYQRPNRTLALAKGAKKYFQNSKIENINILTTNTHSRRSYINFKNCLENINVGCIPRGDEILRKESSVYNCIDDRVSLILTWIYWWFH